MTDIRKTLQQSMDELLQSAERLRVSNEKLAEQTKKLDVINNYLQRRLRRHQEAAANKKLTTQAEDLKGFRAKIACLVDKYTFKPRKK